MTDTDDAVDLAQLRLDVETLTAAIKLLPIDEIRELSPAVQELVRSRRAERLRWAVTTFTLLLVIGFIVVYYQDVIDRRQRTNDRLHRLECVNQLVPTPQCLDVLAPGAAPPSSTPNRRPSTSDASAPAASARGAQRPSAAPVAPAATGARPGAVRSVAASRAPRRAGSASSSPRAVASAGGRDDASTPPPLVRLPSISLCIAGLGLCPAG